MPSLRISRAADEVELAIREGNVRRVVALVDEWGLSKGERVGVACELNRRSRLAAAGEEAALVFDRFDRA
jgi:hypothetical protein